VRSAFTFAVLLLVAWTVQAAPPPKPAWDHLRTVSPASAALVAAAVERSPLVRHFIDDLERSDVIVYVEALASPTIGGLRGRMLFVTWNAGCRYLHVQVDAFFTPQTDQIAMLGHELRHALEVAQAPEVRDVASFRRLFQHIGRESTRDRYETGNARTAERQVRAEVMEGRPSPGVGQ
jgi:hypothetical protein